MALLDRRPRSTGASARPRKVRLELLIPLVLSVPILVWAFSSGPPSAVTGGFGEPNCTDCHIGTAVNAGPGSIIITSPATYASGGVYPITVTVSDPNQIRWGFELSARTSGGTQAGSLTAGVDGFTQRLADVSGIQYMGHTSSGTRLNTGGGVSFTFNWTAPNTSAGAVVFHAAGNAANGNLTNSGDRIYTTSASSQPDTGQPAILSLSPLVVQFIGVAGGSNPGDKFVGVSNIGGGTMNWTAEVQLVTGGAWLGIMPTSGSNAGSVTLSPNIAGLPAGNYFSIVKVTAPGALNSPSSVNVTLNLARRVSGQMISD